MQRPNRQQDSSEQRGGEQSTPRCFYLRAIFAEPVDRDPGSVAELQQPDDAIGVDEVALRESAEGDRHWGSGMGLLPRKLSVVVAARAWRRRSRA
jgi:hypothetical protein